MEDSKRVGLGAKCSASVGKGWSVCPHRRLLSMTTGLPNPATAPSNKRLNGHDVALYRDTTWIRGVCVELATHRSWNGAIFYCRLPRQSLPSTHAAPFGYGPCHANSDPWSSATASVINDYKRFIVVICDAGKQSLDFCFFFGSCRHRRRQRSPRRDLDLDIDMHVLHLVPTDHVAPSPMCMSEPPSWERGFLLNLSIFNAAGVKKSSRHSGGRESNTRLRNHFSKFPFLFT
jgi:hypothetical protein